MNEELNEQFSNKILERIEADNVTPLPCWRFFLVRGSFWLLAGLSAIIGGFAVGTIIFLFVDYHKQGLWAVPFDAIEFLAMVPFLWLIILAMFIAIARISLKHTKKGYRYQLRTVIFITVLLSIIFGSILNFFGVGRIIHELLNEVPLYNYAIYDSKDAWDQPVIGRLAGVVLSIQDKNNFSIRDFGGRVWQVRIGTSTDGLFVPELNSTIRISGFLGSSSSIFISRSVYGWER